ncbi:MULTISPECIES: DNA alkylation repair protein [Nocardiaceae]|jgi:3-methyladenine DNA glycosylase AlkD|nr:MULTISPECIES: DNA alkylation repair protein [Rhodococcus]OZF06388.1 DNA alkylation repair protein [Rhodococcus sp. 15-1189-1-1a]OZF21157.1 DNA alkylation repair protein [Rhodococcus sp. 14-2686-1-2]OZF57656.1 DNA alkylation repair protein [Rhodococcus sp. 14-2470-1b]
MGDVEKIEQELRALSSPDQVDLIARRVDRNQIIGVRMGSVFGLAKANWRLDLGTVRELVQSDWFEVRMVGVSILDARARKGSAADAVRTDLYELYLDEHAHIDTWDLVDRAAPRVIGQYLLDRPKEPLHILAGSANLWERRTSIVACYWLIRNGELDDPVRILEALIDDPEVFVQTALGTALREVKRADPARAAEFHRRHGSRLHPTARRAMKVGRT